MEADSHLQTRKRKRSAHPETLEDSENYDQNCNTVLCSRCRSHVADESTTDLESRRPDGNEKQFAEGLNTGHNDTSEATTVIEVAGPNSTLERTTQAPVHRGIARDLDVRVKQEDEPQLLSSQSRNMNIAGNDSENRMKEVQQGLQIVGDVLVEERQMRASYERLVKRSQQRRLSYAEMIRKRSALEKGMETARIDMEEDQKLIRQYEESLKDIPKRIDKIMNEIRGLSNGQ